MGGEYGYIRFFYQALRNTAKNQIGQSGTAMRDDSNKVSFFFFGKSQDTLPLVVGIYCM